MDYAYFVTLGIKFNTYLRRKFMLKMLIGSKFNFLANKL